MLCAMIQRAPSVHASYGTPVLYFTCEQAADAVYHPCGSACVCVVPAAVGVVLLSLSFRYGISTLYGLSVDRPNAFGYGCANARGYGRHYTADVAILLKVGGGCDGDLQHIKMNLDTTRQNQILHECLLRKCTEEALRRVCEIIIAVRGNPRMKALGRDMKSMLDSKCCVLVCTYVCMCVGL